MDILTPQGKNLLKWLKHLKIASAVADGRVDNAPGRMSDEAIAAEAKAIKTIGNMIRAKYRSRSRYNRVRRYVGAR